MSELSEAEWNCRIAEAMGYRTRVNGGVICQVLAEKHIGTSALEWYSFNILEDPADCLAAIKHFRLTIYHPTYDRDKYSIPIIYELCDTYAMGDTLEQAVFEACKQLVEE